MVVVRVDPSILPVGTMYRSALDQHDREIEKRLPPERATVLDSALLRQMLTLDLRIAPRNPGFPAGRWLLGSAALAEIIRRPFSLRIVPGNWIFALLAAFLAAAYVRSNFPRDRRIVVASIILARCFGISIIFAPLLWISTCFTVGQTPPPPSSSHSHKQT